MEGHQLKYKENLGPSQLEGWERDNKNMLKHGVCPRIGLADPPLSKVCKTFLLGSIILPG